MSEHGSGAGWFVVADEDVVEDYQSYPHWKPMYESYSTMVMKTASAQSVCLSVARMNS